MNKPKRRPLASSPVRPSSAAPEPLPDARPPQRQQQKLKTRQALLKAASALAAEGLRPTVVDVAERAGISRATAYRYFPSREFLVVEMDLPIDQLRQALAQAGQDDPARRIAAMVRTVAEWSYDHQLVLREMLRVSLAPDAADSPYRRPNTRVELIAHELKPLKSELTPAAFRKLSTALTLLLGVEALIVFQDMARVPREQAIETLVWMASSLVDAASRRVRK